MSINADRYPDKREDQPADAAGGADGSAGRRLIPAPRADEAPGSAASARLLEMTAQETDRWRSEARSEADQIVARARTEAAGLVREAQAEAERVIGAARDAAAETTNDARVQAYRIREQSDALRARQDEELARLGQVETEHRERLRQHLTEMLDRVDSSPGDDSQ